jgi:hypothetical protein
MAKTYEPTHGTHLEPGTPEFTAAVEKIEAAAAEARGN